MSAQGRKSDNENSQVDERDTLLIQEVDHINL